MLSKNFASMSDHELKLNIVSLAMRARESRDAFDERLLDAAEDERMKRMLASPNPYEEMNHAADKNGHR